jgi:hypothetical protein
MNTSDRSHLATAARRQWLSPAVKLVGTIGEVLKGGSSSKPSVTLGDPGESTRSQPSLDG